MRTLNLTNYWTEQGYGGDTEMSGKGKWEIVIAVE
jgi:hypothetical protein